MSTVLKSGILLIGGVIACGSALAQDMQLEQGKRGIQNRAGCYTVDYSYTETDSLKAGYTRDNRVYDVTKNKSVKEWIYAEDISPTRIRLQHILFATDISGKLMPSGLLKHQAEDWEYDALFLYEYVAPSHWGVKELKSTPGLWTRKITNLDDGLRYQCASRWLEDAIYPEWSCDNNAPIPGRETRDMGRKDYNVLQRSTRIISYGQSWLERQENIKTIQNGETRTVLAKEFGKDWYVKLPDTECADAQAFVKQRLPFWHLLRETWDQVLTGDKPFAEKMPPGQPPRFVKINELEKQYSPQNLSDPIIRKATQNAILKVIEEYRDR